MTTFIDGKAIEDSWTREEAQAFVTQLHQTLGVAVTGYEDNGLFVIEYKIASGPVKLTLELKTEPDPGLDPYLE